MKFQSTHPSRGATAVVVIYKIAGRISIHAPLTGCDRDSIFSGWWRNYFNPRTPHGVRQPRRPGQRRLPAFQPTHPSRGATPPSKLYRGSFWNFNPRTPHGVRQHPYLSTYGTYIFQSTHPSRGATIPPGWAVRGVRISIHAPLTGCDKTLREIQDDPDHFNPRTP